MELEIETSCERSGGYEFTYSVLNRFAGFIGLSRDWHCYNDTSEAH